MPQIVPKTTIFLVFMNKTQILLFALGPPEGAGFCPSSCPAPLKRRRALSNFQGIGGCFNEEKKVKIITPGLLDWHRHIFEQNGRNGLGVRRGARARAMDRARAPLRPPVATCRHPRARAITLGRGAPKNGRLIYFGAGGA